MTDPLWTDPHRIPLGAAHRARSGAVDAETIQANLFTLSQIGGLYDLIALEVERQHLGILVPWRLDSGAPRVLDYLKARADRHVTRTTSETSRNAQSSTQDQ